jgi:choline dehydrogenase-like flavoprotein
MLHQIRTEPQCLNERERQLLLHLTEAALPAGRYFPAAGQATARKAESVLARFPASMVQGYRALLVALESSALVSYRRRFGQLALPEQLALLESWRCAGVARRLGLRALMAPLKVAHFDDPGFYRSIGCVYEFDAARPEKPRHVRERSHGPDEMTEDMEIECDVVVVGTGAGGAVVAKELAEMGHAVIMLEDGDYFDRSHFNGRPFDMQRKMYRKGGATFAIGNVGIPLPMGRTVGGTTTINAGTCYRPPGRILAKWRQEMGLGEFTDAHMEPYFERVESTIGVTEARAEYLGGAARVIARGCDRLGYHHKPLRRNAPDCDGKGVCCFGCPTDAKRSTNVSYVPMAMRAGAELFYCAKVVRILTEGDRATGVVARIRGRGEGELEPPRTLTVRARAVVLSCGTIMTPVLLQQNRLCNSSGQLGRNLSIHPAAGGLGVFDERIAGYDGIPQGYAIEEFRDEGLLFEGASAPLEIMMTAIPFVGSKLIELAESWEHVAMFGFMVEDTSRGRVRTIRGEPVITYMLNDTDVARLKRGVEILARVFLAAGARRVHPPVHGFDEISSEADLARFRRTRIMAREFELSAYHPLGTARMGSDPRRSVIDSNHESHDVTNLYIVDGSSVPSSLAANPMVTIMAMATRAAERIDARLGATA